MSTSRLPSNFFRSSRRSTTDPPQNHRRGHSYGDTLAVHVQQHHTEGGIIDRRRSVTPTSEISGQMTLRGMERLEKRRTMEELNFLQSKARSLHLNPPVDMRLLDYVSPCDENLVCPICRCAFVDPVVLNECDHCFCRDCIRQTWTTYSPLGPRGDCPACRTPAKLGARSATSKILLNILDDLVVKCPKADEGCPAQVKRGEVQDHVSIYCGYALVECPSDDCQLAVRRKDSTRGCLHYPVSCLACRAETQLCSLEAHWDSTCPDRTIFCRLCESEINFRNLPEHSQRLCPAISIKCPGSTLGCTFRSKKAQIDAHASDCTFAKLTPVIAAQQQRMDEQEAAQKQMSHKLEVLENGFTRMQSIMYPMNVDPDQTSANPNSIPLLQGIDGDSEADFEAETETTRQSRIIRETIPNASQDRSIYPDRPIPEQPGPRTADLSDPYTMDFDLASPFPPPAATGPYASPLHHMLSMHENLREEMSRINTALQELDGRHSMQILNENMRTREEITYMGAQVAGMSRQLHWLTSAQLQRESRGGTAGGSNAAGEIAAAGPSVEAAITSAVRGAARIVNAGREGMAMRRGPSEEGRTKL